MRCTGTGGLRRSSRRCEATSGCFEPDERKSQQVIGIQIAATASTHELHDFLSMVPHLLAYGHVLRTL
jgi:hypothetical protein